MLKNNPDKAAIFLMWKEAMKHPQDGNWRKYEAVIKQGGREFKVTAEFMLNDKMFSCKNLEIKALDRDTIILN